MRTITIMLAGLALVPAPAEARKYKVHRTYATCYNLTGLMADGTYTRPRSVASNVLPLGTKIRLIGRSFHGMRRLVVRDTGAPWALGDGHLDIWFGTPSGRFFSCSVWGKRSVKYKRGWGRP